MGLRVIWGIIQGTTVGDMKGDTNTRSLDYSSYDLTRPESTHITFLQTPTSKLTTALPRICNSKIADKMNAPNLKAKLSVRLPKWDPSFGKLSKLALRGPVAAAVAAQVSTMDMGLA